MSRFSIPTLIAAFLLVLILLIYAFTYQVGFYQAAVRVHLGKADDESVITDAGLHFRWPWPVESIARYDTRLRVLDTPETEIKTRDGKAVIIGSYAVWRIENPLLFYNRVRTVPEAEKQMRDRLSTAQAGVIGQRALSDFVNLDRTLLEANYEAILTDMLKREAVDKDGKRQDSLKDGLRGDYGIAVEQVGISRISLPKEVSKEVFNSMIQERKKRASQYREEGKSRATAITSRAQSDADQILAFAESKSQEIASTGIQASAEILQKIDEQDRELFEWLRWLDVLKATLKQRTTIFIDKDSPLFEPFVHPPVPANERP